MRTGTTLWAGLTWLACGVAVCSAPAPPPQLRHQAYIWQRHWTPALHKAITASAPVLDGWRVLAGEWQSGQIKPIAFDPAPLQGKPVIAVFRINGHLALDASLPAAIRQTLDNWRAAGLEPAGVEIDHDCPVSQLAAYHRFLHNLRPAIAPLPLSITALPAWLGHKELPKLSKTVESVVLQVHAVMNPSRGLFQANQARDWIERWSQSTQTPFHVALPNYGSRVTWNPAGVLTAIESETPRYGHQPGESTRELYVAPQAVEPLLTWLRRSPPAGFVGIVWFRLPTAEDRRAWSLASWHAVIAGRPLTPQLTTEITVPAGAGARDIWLHNTGTIDAELPAAVDLPAQPTDLADALNGYTLERRNQALHFRLTQPNLLRAGQRQMIGWFTPIQPRTLVREPDTTR